MKFLVKVFEESYQDDWEEGEVAGTLYTVKVDEKMFATAQDAVKWFRDNYEHKDYKCGVMGDILVCPQPVQAVRDGYFYDAPEEIVKEWQAGKRRLWNREFRFRLQKVEDFSEGDMMQLADSLGLEAI